MGAKRNPESAAAHFSCPHDRHRSFRPKFTEKQGRIDRAAPDTLSGYSGRQGLSQTKEHLANIEQIMYIFLYLVAAGWMTTTTVLPVRQFRS
jgi:hypothetical protein